MERITTYVLCSISSFILKTKCMGTIHLWRRQFFTIFYPYSPPVGSFLLLSIGKFGQFFTPLPLKNADVLNGWSFIILNSISSSVFGLDGWDNMGIFHSTLGQNSGSFDMPSMIESLNQDDSKSNRNLNSHYPGSALTYTVVTIKICQRL